jgi:mono/diheme cytochrome c family protein/uncharacterized protein YjiS (DUF1127 family)
MSGLRLVAGGAAPTGTFSMKWSPVMTDAFVDTILASGATLRLRRLATLVGNSLHRSVLARVTRRALERLPDELLKDVGLVRSDIPFVAGATACGHGRPTRSMLDRPDRAPAQDGATACRVRRGVLYAGLVAAVAGAASAVPRAALAQDAQIKRGQYLVTLGGCTDCHTPGYFFGKPDAARYLGGSEVGFEIPGLGVFHGPNLTPDRETGLGKWSAEQIGKAITAGQRPDGRVLAPIMPWHAFANLTDDDVRAIVAFLTSLPPVKNKVPGPFGPRDKPTSFVMKVVPPEAAAVGDRASK